MRTRAVCTIALFACAAGSTTAGEPKRYAERTPQSWFPLVHTQARAGHADTVRAHARPGIEPHQAGGYVGGGGLVRGAGRGPCEGTFGWDYVGLGRRPGRIFLGFLYDTPRQPLFQPKYRTDTFDVKDVVAAAPFKRAVKEAKAEKREGKQEGGEGHEGGGH